MSVGNDVVDLLDPETRLGGLHPRFAGRVFTASEREALAGGNGDSQTLFWAVWAAKESAYKAVKRMAPATAFAPKRFEVAFETWPEQAPAALAHGSVLHEGRRLSLRVRLDGSSVHAVACTSESAGAEMLSAVETAAGDPSAAVRRLALRALGEALGLEAADLEIRGRPPVVSHRGRPLAAPLSLSHHGRLVAFAAVLGRDGR